MKRLAALLLLAVPALALARDVHLGDSLEEVRSALGEPRGQARLDGRLVLFYDRGEVELVDGRVTNSDFSPRRISPPCRPNMRPRPNAPRRSVPKARR